MNKVFGGTPQGSKSICLNCRNSQKIIGLNFQTVVICRVSHPTMEMRFPVAECNIFDDKRVPSLYDMEQIAWEVKSRSRGKVGFKKGAENLEVKITPPREKNPDQPATPRGLSDSRS